MSFPDATIAEQTFDTTNGEPISLAGLKGQRVVLFFYPKASTPGCTKEAEGFRDHHEQFAKAGYTVLGASRDSLRAQQRFAEKLNLNYPLIADPKEDFCNAFGVMADKQMYGKTVRGIQRSTFVLDESGEIMHEWRKLKVPGHVEAVLGTLGLETSATE